MDDDADRSPGAALREVLVSPAFLVGAAMLVIWGVAVVVLFEGICHGVDARGAGYDECGAINTLAHPYWMLVGILPGAYLVAGLLAPRRPFLTGLLLGVVHIGVSALTNLFTPEPEGPVYIPRAMIALAVVVVAFVGMMVTGLVGHLARRLWGRGRRAS